MGLDDNCCGRMFRPLLMCIVGRTDAGIRVRLGCITYHNTDIHTPHCALLLRRDLQAFTVSIICLLFYQRHRGRAKSFCSEGGSAMNRGTRCPLPLPSIASYGKGKGWGRGGLLLIFSTKFLNAKFCCWKIH